MNFKSKNDAIISHCKKYRYVLWRNWDKSKQSVMFIGLNPSKADIIQDDPTIYRCINFAKSWGYGGIIITNLFAYRTKDPRELKITNNPIGKDNDMWINKISKEDVFKVAAWGNHGTYLNRSENILKSISNLNCIKKNKSGEPSHPLYLKTDLKTIPLNN